MLGATSRLSSKEAVVENVIGAILEVRVAGISNAPCILLRTSGLGAFKISDIAGGGLKAGALEDEAFGRFGFMKPDLTTCADSFASSELGR